MFHIKCVALLYRHGRRINLSILNKPSTLSRNDCAVLIVYYARGDVVQVHHHLYPVSVCLLKNLLIERLGRRLMLMGGFILMTIWAVVFTISLWFEVDKQTKKKNACCDLKDNTFELFATESTISKEGAKIWDAELRAESGDYLSRKELTGGKGWSDKPPETQNNLQLLHSRESEAAERVKIKAWEQSFIF